MPGKQWKVKIDDTMHTVKIEHGSMVRRFAVQVDGKQVNLQENVLIDQGNRLTFKINDHLCHILVLMSTASTFDYDFILDGYSVQSKQKVELPAEMKEDKGFLKHFLINTLAGILLIFGVGYLSGHMTKPGTQLAKTISSVLILMAVAVFLYVAVKRRKRK
jgi:hypothetical protein